MSTATEWPRAEVLLSAEGHAHVIFEGVEADLSKPTPKEARAAVVTHLSHRARALGHPIFPDAGLLSIDGAGHGFSGQAWDRAMGGTAAYLQRIGVLGG